MNSKFLLISAFILTSSGVNAQVSRNTYAITGKSNNIFYWADIKQVDINTGKTVRTIFETDKTKFKTNVLDKQQSVNSGTNNPTVFGVAACALDVQHNRLYFAPMHFSELRYIDLSKSDAEFTVVKYNLIKSPNASAYQPEESQMTKMVIAADGYGYALTNDGNHLIRFSTGKKVQVDDLGSLIDAKENNGISVHDKLTGWGGDMVADAFGNLVAVTAQHHIYSIDVRTKVATHMGVISGLPQNYTTNGVVVNDEGDLVVSSANVLEGLYKVSMNDFSAAKIVCPDKPFNASDMANGNFLSQKKFDILGQNNISANMIERNIARIFPNPVSGKSFNILTDGQLSGEHQIVLTDINGKILQTSIVNITKGNKTQTVSFNNKYVNGIYFVKVYNAAKQSVLTEKVIVE